MDSGPCRYVLGSWQRPASRGLSEKKGSQQDKEGDRGVEREVPGGQVDPDGQAVTAGRGEGTVWAAEGACRTDGRSESPLPCVPARAVTVFMPPVTRQPQEDGASSSREVRRCTKGTPCTPFPLSLRSALLPDDAPKRCPHCSVSQRRC